MEPTPSRISRAREGIAVAEQQLVRLRAEISEQEAMQEAALKVFREAILSGESTGEPFRDLTLFQFGTERPDLIAHFEEVDQRLRACPKSEWVLVGFGYPSSYQSNEWTWEAFFGKPGAETGLKVVRDPIGLLGVAISLSPLFSFHHHGKGSLPDVSRINAPDTAVGPVFPGMYKPSLASVLRYCKPDEGQTRDAKSVCAIGNQEVVQWLIDEGKDGARDILRVLELPQQDEPHEWQLPPDRRGRLVIEW